MGFASIIFLTTILVAAGQLANTIFVPAMTIMSRDLGVMPAYIQGFIAAYLLPYGVSQFFYGPISDQYGRKPVIFLGLVIFSIGALTSAFGINYSMVLIGCVMQGIGAGVGGVMCRTLMRDCFTGTRLQISNSFLTMALIFAPLFAPLIGGILTEHYGWRSSFLFLFGFAVIVLVAEVLFLPETKPAVSPSSLFNKYKQILHNRIFLSYAAILTLAFSSVAIFEASFGIILGDTLNMDPKAISILFIIPLPFSFIGSYSAGYFGKKFPLNRIIFANIILALISSIVLLIPGLLLYLNVYIILIPVCLLLFTVGTLAPTATTCAIEPLGAIAGTAGAVLGGLQNLGAGAFTAIASFIPQTTQIPLGILLVTQTVLMLFIFLKYIKGLKTGVKKD